MKEIHESCAFTLFLTNPTTYEEAAKKEKWQDAIKELMGIQKYETCELMDLPNGKNAVGLKWVFKTKNHVDRSIQKHKT